MKALTVRQPWAHLIATGQKTVENRTGGTNHRGPLAIHVARTLDLDALWLPHVRTALGLPTGVPTPDDWADRYLAVRAALDAQLGQVVAVVDLTDCHLSDGTCCGPWAIHHNPAAPGPGWGRPVRHYQLADVRPLAVPFPAVGRLGLWNLDDQQVLAGLPQVVTT